MIAYDYGTELHLHDGDGVILDTPTVVPVDEDGRDGALARHGYEPVTEWETRIVGDAVSGPWGVVRYLASEVEAAFVRRPVAGAEVAR